jgi:transcriptional regulator with XRE-family HTH domain
MPRRQKTSHDSRRSSAIGNRLREAREAAGLSQSQLGQLLGGRLQSAIAAYEAGRNAIPGDLIFPICRELAIRAEWLADGREPMNPKPGDYEAQLYEDYPENILKEARGLLTAGTAAEKTVLTNVMIGTFRALKGLNPKRNKAG